MTDSTAHFSKLDHLAYRPLAERQVGSDHPVDGGMSQLLDQLITPTWAEVAVVVRRDVHVLHHPGGDPDAQAHRGALNERLFLEEPHGEIRDVQA
jgi:hypothetical protein